MRRCAASLRPTSASTSSTRPAGTPIVWASSHRWVRPVRPGCTAAASSRVPTTAPGLGSSAYRRPSTTAAPAVGATRPVIIRIVVVLPAPFGPRKPVTVPGSSVNETSSTTVRSPYFLVSPLTVIMVASVATGLSGLGARQRREAPWPRRPEAANPLVLRLSAVIRKLTADVLRRATRREAPTSYAPAHEPPAAP